MVSLAWCIRTVEQTAHVIVPYAIQALQSAGYQLVTVAECLGVEPYQNVTTPETVSLVLCPIRFNVADFFPRYLQGSWSC